MEQDRTEHQVRLRQSAVLQAVPCFDRLSPPVVIATLSGENGYCLRAAGGEVFVPDRACKTVSVFDARGGLLRRLGSGQFHGHVMSAAVSGECVYSADRAAHRVVVLGRADGALVRSFGSKGSAPGHLSRPYGVAVHHGLVFVSDTENRNIAVFRKDGGFVRNFGGRGDASCQLKWPTGLCIDDGEARIAVPCRVHAMLVALWTLEIFRCGLPFLRCFFVFHGKNWSLKFWQALLPAKI
jgi:DNA-binding beta-propeller fold protein YncE